MEKSEATTQALETGEIKCYLRKSHWNACSRPSLSENIKLQMEVVKVQEVCFTWGYLDVPYTYFGTPLAGWQDHQGTE